jgi:hypothetical protein
LIEAATEYSVIRNSRVLPPVRGCTTNDEIPRGLGMTQRGSRACRLWLDVHGQRMSQTETSPEVERATQASPIRESDTLSTSAFEHLSGRPLVSVAATRCNRLTISLVRPGADEPVSSGARRWRGGSVVALIRERFEQHRLQQSPVSQRLDQEVTASIVLMDLDATATGDSLGVK